MAGSAVWLVLLYCTLLHSPSWCSVLTKGDLEELDKISTWVIKHSFPCSATCGLGLRIQELCPITGKGNISDTICKLRTVRCLDTWQCGLKTQTATAGQHLVLDCLEEVMEAMGRFAFVVSWHFAHGVITSDNSLFTRYEAHSLDKVVLDPLREEDSGTYRCDVLDTGKQRVKRMYKGVKVLSLNELSLNFTKGLINWEDPVSLISNFTTKANMYTSTTVRNITLISMFSSAVLAAVTFLILWVLRWIRPRSTRLFQNV